MAAKNNDTQIKIYCAQTILPHLEVLKKKTRSIQRRRDIEDIHDLRVSSRRIRTCLSIFENTFPAKKIKKWQKDIKEITQSFGQVRDLDVQIDLLDKVMKPVEDRSILSGLRRVRLRLKQKRQIRQTDTEAKTHAILDSTTLIELHEWAKTALAPESQETTTDQPDQISQETSTTPPEPSETVILDKKALFQLAYAHLQKRLDEFLFFEVFIYDPERIEELHQMRISAKRLRYSLEVFSNLYEYKSDFALDIARQSQQYLGEIHDADVWMSFLPKFAKKEHARINKFYGYKRPFYRIKPGIDFLLKNRQEERERLYKLFLEDWKKWKMEETWLNLRKIIFLTNLEEQQPGLNSPPNT